MSFLNNLKGIAEKASEEYKKAAEDVRGKIDEESSETNSELMSKMKSIASKTSEEVKSMTSKANEELKKNQYLEGRDLKARHKMDETELKSAWQRAAEQMDEDLSDDVRCYLEDIILSDENCIYKIRNSARGKASQLVLTDRCLYIASKGIRGGHAEDLGGGILGTALAIGQVSLRIYPIEQISFVEIKPTCSVTMGHLQIFTSSTLENDSETKFTFDSRIGYFKSILVYRKLMEIKNKFTTQL